MRFLAEPVKPAGRSNYQHFDIIIELELNMGIFASLRHSVTGHPADRASRRGGAGVHQTGGAEASAAADVHELRARLAALDKVQAVIEFRLDGTVINANENFLRAFGYSLAEIQGRHHGMFVDGKYRSSREYADFWTRLNRGEYDAGEYLRIGKGGREVWINASYNPIFDADGKPFKIVKHATDITQQKLRGADFAGQMAALNRVQAVIEFRLDGTIITANANFLDTLGYTLAEIQGKHHSMFVDAAYRDSPEYAEFWARLHRGELDAGEYRRIGKGGKEVWINASYNPIFDADGKPFKVVKYATDITRQKLRDADFAGQMAAINKAQAVIEFRLDGTVITANANFLDTLGYTLAEIQGKHHRMFVDEDYRNSREYAECWARLNRGEYDVGEYPRIGKGGKVVWISASYNPIFNAAGKPVKIVKYATDVTAQKNLRRMIDSAMQETATVMSALSQGRLTEKMVGNYTGEFAQLAGSINGYVERLTGIVQEIKQAAETVKNGSSEIALGNANLGQRTEEQASSLEETSSAMEEITITVQQNAANAAQANVSASAAREAAEKGGRVVGSAIAAMESISASSKRINDIIGVIDEIAFQTNLLALNAAVEAARAGDQGRGFAVVADEVRNLAGRSAKAAKEIKSLIQDSNERVSEGATLVNTSGQTLKEIVIAVKKVGDIIAEIATASEEQSTGLAEINRAIMSIDETTQQNAALVEEAAAASESLSSQAETLERLISFFNPGAKAAAPQTRRLRLLTQTP
ncbi:MAG: methyl-accepting chemotaxis protein [Gammaproteobacteria bacterium]